MICSNCNQDVEDGAVYCGNCGQPMSSHLPPVQNAQDLPDYAAAKPAQHKGEVTSLLSVLFGVIGIAASILMFPAVGLGLGTTGLVLGTLTRRSHRRVMTIIGIIASTLAIVVSLGVWAYVITHDKELSKARNKSSGETSSVQSTSFVSTSCYNIQFPFTLNTDHDEHDDCDVRVFEGNTIEASNDVYKIYGNKVPGVTEANFAEVAKEALEKDIKTTLPGFTISGQRIAQFAGSPAYIINAEDKENDVAVVEAAVLHSTDSGVNLFSLVHATKGKTTNLKDLEDAWRWK